LPEVTIAAKDLFFQFAHTIFHQMEPPISTGGGANVLCDVGNTATVTSEPEHFCAYHPNASSGGVASVSHLDLRRPGVAVQPGSAPAAREVHTATPGRRFVSNTLH
jgi:hypothetical protein